MEIENGKWKLKMENGNGKWKLKIRNVFYKLQRNDCVMLN